MREDNNDQRINKSFIRNYLGSFYIIFQMHAIKDRESSVPYNSSVNTRMKTLFQPYKGLLVAHGLILQNWSSKLKKKKIRRALGQHNIIVALGNIKK